MKGIQGLASGTPAGKGGQGKESKEEKEQRVAYETEIELRNTKWSDLKVEQKVERMREVIKETQATQRYYYNEFHPKLKSLEEHSHNGGKVVVPMQIHRMQGEQSADRSIGFEYF